MKWELEGKPHWPLTTYEKLWGFWKFAGIQLIIGSTLFLFLPVTASLSPLTIVWLAGLKRGMDTSCNVARFRAHLASNGNVGNYDMVAGNSRNYS